MSSRFHIAKGLPPPMEKVLKPSKATSKTKGRKKKTSIQAVLDLRLVNSSGVSIPLGHGTFNMSVSSQGGPGGPHAQIDISVPCTIEQARNLMGES